MDEDVYAGHVLIATNPNISHVGGVFGPYASKAAAKKALEEDFDFPHPEDVLIRPLYSKLKK